MARTLQYSILPFYEGRNNTQEVEMPDYVSWEIRYYCDACGKELAESNVPLHKCEESQDY